MTNKDTGGSAFPIVFEKEDYINDGLTMRDYFAAKAMQMKFGTEHSSIPMTEMASICYQMADAMLEARK